MSTTVTLDRLTYPVTEVIRISGLSRSEVYRRVKTGDLDSIRVGAKSGKIAVPAAALAKLLNGTTND
ncbi:hypothetical protein DEA06_06815 [Microbacterium sp. Gd 4-13]|uniref:hypothetical protein n=1 Tax=Microbacterium sp. Gd 4-13 TaxID=2173179 RepID=UPI000D58905E|nr:hypothetical protein [Microbacterium sp. Gd 4-13]PVW05445.1 hypothetical protein DEA06_06815 [Microbacterium sp. Gd 4-13]